MASTILAQPATRTPSPQVDSRRQSYISSIASYQTARDSLAPGSHYSHSLPGSSRASSINTLGPHPINRGSEPDINTIHMAGHLANGVHAEEVHIVKVTDDSVHAQTGPISDGFYQDGNSLARAIPSSAQGMNQPRVGPPPPSPPASVERVDEEYANAPPLPPKMQLSKSEPVSRPVTFEESGRDGKQSAPSAFSFPRPGVSRAGSSPHEIRYRPSTDTKVLLSSVASSTSVSLPRALQILHEPNGQSSEAPFTETSGSQPSKMAYQSPDGHLQPPPPVIRPTRRNTTGSSPRIQHTTLHQAYGSQPFAYDDSEVGEELASDIQMQAEQIRRERNSKRAKAQQHEAALTRSTSLSRAPEDQVLVGNLIGEDHVNYVLMYNMLTGIRIAVSDKQYVYHNEHPC
jgi:1-phosphatidylinositol-4-phosphate 5-kinase